MTLCSKINHDVEKKCFEAEKNSSRLRRDLKKDKCGCTDDC